MMTIFPSGKGVSVTREVFFQPTKKTPIKVNRQRLKFVMRRPELKIHTLAKWLISPSVGVIIKICKICDNQNLC